MITTPAGVNAVYACYRIFLGRLPENDEVITERQRQAPHILVSGFLASSEFRTRIRNEILNKEKSIAQVYPTEEDLEIVCNYLSLSNDKIRKLKRGFTIEQFFEYMAYSSLALELAPDLKPTITEYLLFVQAPEFRSLKEETLLSEPSLKILSIIFDLEFYSNQVSEKLVTIRDAVEHYIRQPLELRKDPSPFFSRQLYSHIHPSISPLRVDPVLHYIDVGRFQRIDPHPLFDVRYIMQQTGYHSPDTLFLDFLDSNIKLSFSSFHRLVDVEHIRLQTGFDGDLIDLFKKCAQCSLPLDFNPCALFDCDYYTSQSDNRKFPNELIDYIVDRSTGIRTHPLFDDAFYATNLGSDLGRLSPLQHYLEHWDSFAADPSMFVDLKFLNHQLSVYDKLDRDKSSDPLSYALQHNVGVNGPLLHPHLDTRVIDKAFENIGRVYASKAARFSAVLRSLDRLNFRYDNDNIELSVVILNYHKPVYSALSIISALNALRFCKIEIIYIENGGEFFHFEEIRRMFSGISYVRTEKLDSNKYFGEGNNIGIDLCCGEYVLLLNNDCFLLPDFGSVFRSIKSSRAHHAVGALMLYPDGKVQEYGGFVSDDGQVIQQAKHMSVSDLKNRPVEEKVGYASAACLILSRSAIKTIVGFDPIFEPFYYEDTDLCRRLTQAGIDIVVNMRLRAIHIENASTREFLEGSRFNKMISDHRALFGRRWMRNAGVGALVRKQPQNESRKTDGWSKRPVAVVYTPYGIRPGGGERYVFSAAHSFSVSHRVVICSREIFSVARVCFLLNSLGIPQFEFEVCDLAHLPMMSDKIDVWFAMANEITPELSGFGRTNLYHLQFPFPWRNVSRSSFDLINSYDVVIVNSEFTRKWTLRRFREAGILKHPPVEIIYPPVRNLRREFVKNSKTLKVITVGRFFVGGHSKRQDIFLEILAKARSLSGSDIIGTLIGSVHPSSEAESFFIGVTNAAEKMGGVNILIEASNEEIAEELLTADVYIHCSGFGIVEGIKPEAAEHFGITIVEAINSGCIPLVFGIGGPAEIIEKTRAGLKFRTVDEAANLLVQLIDPLYRAELSKSTNKEWIINTDEEFFMGKIRSLIGLGRQTDNSKQAAG